MGGGGGVTTCCQQFWVGAAGTLPVEPQAPALAYSSPCKKKDFLLNLVTVPVPLQSSGKDRGVVLFFISNKNNRGNGKKIYHRCCYIIENKNT
jgi:hypothetical protein